MNWVIKVLGLDLMWFVNLVLEIYGYGLRDLGDNNVNKVSSE